MSREQKHNALGVKFIFTEYLSIRLDVEQKADQITSFVPAPLRDNLTKMLGKVKNCILRQQSEL